MADQEFLASFAVDIDEAGVSRLQQVLEENWELADEVAAAFEAATAAIREYQKAALGGDNPSGEGNRDDGSGKNGLAGSMEGSRDDGSLYYPDTFYGDRQSAYFESHGGLDDEISRYLYNRIGSRADSDFALELNAAIRELADAEKSGADTADYLEQVKSLMPDLIQGVREIVDRYDEPAEPTTTESSENRGLEGALNLESAREELAAFREEAALPVALSGNASGMVSAAQSAYAGIRSIFSRPITIKAVVEEEDGDGIPGDGQTLKMSVGGRFTRPTEVQVAEDGDAEYIIPVKKENRAVPLLKQLLGELSPAARASLSLGDGAVSLISGGIAAGQPTAAAQITQNNSNVSAPVTIQVRSTGTNAEQVGQKLYDTTERYLLRTLRSAFPL